MNEIKRHGAIIALLDEQQFIKVSTIIEQFNISPATARRDLTKLDDLGKLRKVRGGAERIESVKKVWSPLHCDNTEYYSEKVAIAKAAASLCQPADSVVINCGSTAFMLGQELCGEDIKIITNYFPLASYLIEQDHECVIITGGQYNKSKNIFLSPTSAISATYVGTWMFTSGKGLTEQGLYKTDMLTAVTEQQMLTQIGKLVVVVDSSKVGLRSGMLFCPSEKIDIVITGKDADANVVSALRKQGIDVILV